MTVAVTGATGFVGRHVVRELVSRGISVRALVRDRAKAASVLPKEHVTLVVGDALNDAILADLVDGTQAVVHTIGIRRELPEDITFERLHVRATSLVLDATRAAGVRRFVHVSALGVRANAPTAYQRSKYQSEQLVKKSGLAWTIFRPSLIHGAEGEFTRMVRGWVLGREMPWVVLPYFCTFEKPSGFPPKPKPKSAKLAPIAVQDVARAIIESLSCDEAVGEIYAMSGSETVEWPELLREMSNAVRLKEKDKPIIPIPAQLGWLKAKGAEIVGMAAMLPFGTSEPIIAAEDNVCSNEKLTAHLGVKPLGFHESLASYAGTI